jgi:hypothetical protein
MKGSGGRLGDVSTHSHVDRATHCATIFSRTVHTLEQSTCHWHGEPRLRLRIPACLSAAVCALTACCLLPASVPAAAAAAEGWSSCWGYPCDYERATIAGGGVQAEGGHAIPRSSTHTVVQISVPHCSFFFIHPLFVTAAYSDLVRTRPGEPANAPSACTLASGGFTCQGLWLPAVVVVVFVGVAGKCTRRSSGGVLRCLIAAGTWSLVAAACCCCGCCGGGSCCCSEPPPKAPAAAPAANASTACSLASTGLLLISAGGSGAAVATAAADAADAGEEAR